MEHEALRPSAAVKASVSGDGLILLDVEGGMVLSANAIGARIWHLIEQRLPVPDIARTLAHDYTISLERAERDVAAFVAQLLSRGVVAREPRP
jgi:Coenzyme PQQ synthesis protein D (PqqD)